MAAASVREEEFRFKVLGRTLTHLGTQMYKRREAAIAELVANAWDAGAPAVEITLPDTADYDPESSVIVIADSGSGMTERQVRDDYLVVARNRREDGPSEIAPMGARTQPKRPVMGRKGIGKLAGFGLARIVRIDTWTKDSLIGFELDVGRLEAEDNQVADVKIKAKISAPPKDGGLTGTRVTLSGLKHKSPPEKEILKQSLARRFSRRVRGEMRIRVNEEDLGDPTPPLRERVPAEPNRMVETTLPAGTKLRYWYGFAERAIGPRELRGFSVIVRGRTAQSPPFFFDVEGTATGQHSTRYVIGDIEADFLDEDASAEDVISTDRQELDWDDERVVELRKWGQELSRKALADCAKRMGEDIHNAVLKNEDFKERLDDLDGPSRTQAERFLKALGRNKEDLDERTEGLADQIIRAFEYQSFHDVIEKMGEVIDQDPAQLDALLDHLASWGALESRAIREIVEGRIFIVDKFQGMILEDAPETAPRIGVDNLHDLMAEFPWLLAPRWTLVDEEKQISKKIRDWDKEEADDSGVGERYDFLALTNQTQLVVIEIKRPGIAVDFDEIQRLERYQERLTKGSGKEEVHAVLVYGGALNVTAAKQKELAKRDSLTLLPWSKLFDGASAYLDQYRDVLEGHPRAAGATAQARELKSVRRIRDGAAVHRGAERRKKGLGPSD